jgi:hypothetical protein
MAEGFQVTWLLAFNPAIVGLADRENALPH